MKTKILSLFFTFSFLTPNISFAFTKSECRDCTKEVKDQVADIRKSFKLSKKADVVVLHPGEKGAQELKEIVEGNKIDETDVVLVPLEGEADKNEKKQTEGYVVIVKNLSKHVSGVLGAFTGFAVYTLFESRLLTYYSQDERFKKIFPNYTGAPSRRGEHLQKEYINWFRLFAISTGYAGAVLGQLIGKKFGKWVVQPLPEEIKKSAEPSTSAPSSSDTPASN